MSASGVREGERRASAERHGDGARSINASSERGGEREKRRSLKQLQDKVTRNEGQIHAGLTSQLGHKMKRLPGSRALDSLRMHDLSAGGI